MINPNELMLGNWVLYDKPIQIEGVTENAIIYNGIKAIIVRKDDINPIQLNKEILEKCGFHEIENWFNNSERCFSNDNDDKIIYYKESDQYLLVGMHRYFNYLHELQNIYFLYRKEQLIVDYEID